MDYFSVMTLLKVNVDEPLTIKSSVSFSDFTCFPEFTKASIKIDLLRRYIFKLLKRKYVMKTLDVQSISVHMKCVY